MERWVEAADWIVWQLCGSYVRNACTAGYKGILQDGGATRRRSSWAPCRPASSRFVADKLDHPIGQLGDRAGGLTAEAAAWTGLPEGIAVAVGNVDAHVTAPAAQAVGRRPDGRDHGHLHLPRDERRGAARGAGHVRRRRRRHRGRQLGLRGRPERGRRHLRLVHRDVRAGGVRRRPRQRRGESLHEHLTRLAAEQEIGEHGLVALDWHSGNRSVLVDHELSGLVVGQTLATRPEHVYRALLEATAFGTRVIVETFRDSGVPVEEFIVAGGLAKNALLMQIYADVTRLPLSIIDSEQGPALGSAIHAAVAAGAYADVPTAAKSMGKVRKGVYLPDEGRAAAYDALFEEYLALHDHFGRRPPRDAPAQGDPPRRGRAALAEGGGPMTVVADVQDDDRAAAPRGLRAARAADPLPAGGVDRGQRLRPGARPRPARDQAQRRRPTTT